MKLRTYSRFPWLDLWILPAFLLIGWAIFRMARAEPQIARAEQNVLQVRAAFVECQKWLKEDVGDMEGRRRESDRAWQEITTIRAEFMSVAERLESGVPELERALDETGSPKGAGDRQRTLQELSNWIAKEKERLSVEQLDSRSKELKTRLEAGELSGSSEPLRLNQDLGLLVAAVDLAYRQYLSDFKNVTENFGKPLVSALVATRNASAHQALERLTELGREARQDAQTLKVASEAQPGGAGSQIVRRREEMLQTFLEAGSPAEFARRIGTGDGNLNGQGPSLTVSAVRTVRYGLLVTLAALAAFVLVDAYRRMVVSPLRLKLVERESQIEHQKKLAHFEELAAGLAHEIRNPLTAISARLYTIQRKLRQGTPEFQDTVVIGSEIERANLILKEFIQVTRPAPPRLELLTAGSLLEDISHLMSPQLERKAVRLEVQLPARTRFYGDQQQLKQVLVNLVQNAAESMDRGGEVILRAREERVPFKGALTSAAIIEVEDNGPGIRPEVQERLFEPFFSTKKEGTGLGLPISARIIDRHGGTLDFETQPEHGTIFRIVLPSYEEQ
jgi:signal transduction histidine kinase